MITLMLKQTWYNTYELVGPTTSILVYTKLKVYKYTGMHTSIQETKCIHVYTALHVHMYTSIHVCVYAMYMHVYVYTCIW